jgi:hypothetical protein
MDLDLTTAINKTLFECTNCQLAYDNLELGSQIEENLENLWFEGISVRRRLILILNNLSLLDNNVTFMVYCCTELRATSLFTIIEGVFQIQRPLCIDSIRIKSHQLLRI